MIRKLFVLGLTAAIVACGPLDNEVEPPSERDVYPTEGIGVKEGNVIADLSFTADDGSVFSLGGVFADQKNRVLLMSSSAGWCQPCMDEAPKLEALHEEFAAKGLVVVTAMFQDADYNAATMDVVRNWKKKYKATHPVVLDDEFLLGNYYDPNSVPMNMIVDVDTMTIKRILKGFDEGVIRALITEKVGR